MKIVLCMVDENGSGIVVGPFPSTSDAERFGAENAERTSPLPDLATTVTVMVTPEEYVGVDNW